MKVRLPQDEVPLEFLTLSFFHNEPPSVNQLQLRFSCPTPSSHKGFCLYKLLFSASAYLSLQFGKKWFAL